MEPIIITADNIAKGWEESLIKLFLKGARIKTEYDGEDEEESFDSPAVISISNSFREPRIHLGFFGGIEDLEKYRQEVVRGIHDHWINPKEGKWTYTYHQRLTSYNKYNQLEYILDKLSESLYSRRAQAITWQVEKDNATDDPPCLQRIWCRVVEKENRYYLQMHTHWRSRDAYKAAYMNMYGLTELQKELSLRLSARLNKQVFPGAYIDISDSYHIYGKDLKDFKNRFLKNYVERKFEERTLSSKDPIVLEGIRYGKKLLEKEIEGT